MARRLPATSRGLSRPVGTRVEPSRKNNQIRLILVDTLSKCFSSPFRPRQPNYTSQEKEPAATLKTRLVMFPMMITRDSHTGRGGLLFATNKPTFSWSKSLIDGVAFLTFPLPVYGLILWIVGADATEVCTLFASTALLMLIVSRPIGLLLQAMRGLASTWNNASVATKSLQSCLLVQLQRIYPLSAQQTQAQTKADGPFLVPNTNCGHTQQKRPEAETLGLFQFDDGVLTSS
ncbi:MAG: L-alanine exporter AlaE [Shimia sp.]|uniref:L-alanine exporter AlaE n=1 Tax=Shimia sp. TaxID=1954381 RepID=UPI0040581A31